MKMNKKMKYIVASLFVVMSLFVVSSVVAGDIDEEPIITVPDVTNTNLLNDNLVLDNNLLLADNVPSNNGLLADTDGESLFNKGSSKFSKGSPKFNKGVDDLIENLGEDTVHVALFTSDGGSSVAESTFVNIVDGNLKEELENNYKN
jgi:hypothetical protein